MFPTYVWVTCLRIYEPVCINSAFPTPAHPRQLPLLLGWKTGTTNTEAKPKTVTGQVDLLWESTVPEERYIIYPEVEETTEEEGN